MPVYTYKEMCDAFSGDGPRYIWIMLPAGKVVDDVIGEISAHLKKGDMIIDGGNGFYKDAIRRAESLSDKGIRFMDVGVSGGPEGARSGACMMVGGTKENYQELEELFRDANVDEGYSHFEGYGAGHFVKMVHNGIEYGMMEAIAEGFALMNTCGEVVKECTYDLDLKKVARVYNHGSVIESRLMGWLVNAFEVWGTDLEPVSGKADQLGEGKWAVEVAEELEVHVGAIKVAIEAREHSQKAPSFGGKLIQAMRGQFGGHPVLWRPVLPEKK